MAELTSTAIEMRSASFRRATGRLALARGEPNFTVGSCEAATTPTFHPSNLDASRTLVLGWLRRDDLWKRGPYDVEPIRLRRDSFMHAYIWFGWRRNR